MAEQATHPGDVVTKDRIKLPLWMWIVVGGIVLGGTVYVYKARKANTAQQAAANASGGTTTTPSPSTPAYVDPTTILPMFQGTTVQNMAPPASPVAPPGPPPDVRTVLNTDVFNENGWSATAKQSPWRLIVANPGESWLDITARMYGYADNYSKVTDPASQARIQSVADFIKKTNAQWTGSSPGDQGPKPGAVVVYR